MYSGLSTMALMGTALITLALIVTYYKPQKQGATKSCRLLIKFHQYRRRSHMLTHGGLPVDMRRAK